uniref:UDP-N-acetyl-D-mannosamine dehydrogenase n=1 Tax=Tessaracoccus timonensis TaxID=2161816 RepID=UPI0015745D28|nr:UDP-N-acetyl-D-mannosamine dehydrogenase [Tessaracoccus timonensis]
MDVHQRESVAVIGLGYIGLPTAAILADRGHKVVGVDVSDKHVDAVNAGTVPFIEPDLADFVARNVANGNLRAQKETPKATAYIVAVPTPFKANHHADLSYIDAAVDNIAPQLEGDELIILESTSPPGATEHMAARILAARPDLSLDGAEGTRTIEFAHAPERVLPGRVMIELVTNDRIVGGLTPEAGQRARALYKTFCEAEVHVTDATTAEMAKLTENAFRDVNIAFANELSIISENLGINVFELIELANKHPRVNILQPGPGVGGHCIAVDPWFIVSSTPELARLIRTAREVNDSKPEYVMNRVAGVLGDREDAAIACLGLAFKPDIDDMRASPALGITKELAERYPRARILAVEPNIEALPKGLDGIPNVVLTDMDRVRAEADVVILLVDHTPFKELPADQRPAAPLIDTRGVWL